MYLLARRKTKMATTIQSHSMVSRRSYIYIVLTIMCGLAMRTCTAMTCTISGQEDRVRKQELKNDIEDSCESNDKCVDERYEELSSNGKTGTLVYNPEQGRTETLTLLLENITSLDIYKKIHLLTCENTTCRKKGKLRFGRSGSGPTFTTVFEYFQNYSITQWCTCYSCKCQGKHCYSCDDETCLEFFCNCKFTWESKNNAVRLSPTSTPVSKPDVITTLLIHSTWPQTTAEPITTTGISAYLTTTHVRDTTESMSPKDHVTSPKTASTWPQTTAKPTTTTGISAYLTTTHAPDVTEAMSPTDHVTSLKTDYVSAARQSDEDSLPVMAVVGGVTALVVIVSGLTVFVCLWRRRNKKPSDCSGPGNINPSYGDLQDKERADCNDKAGNDVHTYDMADDPKHETTYGQDYSYANFGGQPKFQDVIPSLKKDSLVKEPKTACKADAGNAYFLIEGGISSQNDDYDHLAKGNTEHHSIPAEHKYDDISANYFDQRK